MHISNSRRREMTPREILDISPIIPVVEIENSERAVDLAQILLEGGINIIEVTLRTKDAHKAVENIIKNVPKMIVGAGTVLNPEQYDKVCDMGVSFAISPGYTDKLLNHSMKNDTPLIPGVATASEIMHCLDYGFDTFKLFPANIAGGVNAIKSFAGPFKDVVFCPTGGVNEENIQDYLNLCNVGCVGGTWLASKKLIENGDFDLIKRNCKEALSSITRDRSHCIF
jgi:2-dehydro-3-deoxyphosphogluconate aldolase / (4S)-4-hydroxy-2-oxoglutarate aldolase